jgi:polyhydroxyalkanoic acid synthase PhaR subunit
VGDVIEREEFLEPSSRFLQSYASFYKVFKRNSEEYLKNLQIPVRSDITRIAGLVVNLEEKVDRIEEVLEDFEYGYAEPATSESVQQLETRLDRVEGKLDRLLAALEGTQNGGAQVPDVAAETNGSATEVSATDAARRKALELGVDLSEVEGTGNGGQITVEDVRRKGEN